MNKTWYNIIDILGDFMDNVGIIGAGSLGTALAQIVAQNADNVFLFLRREELANTINTTGINNEYYPNVKLEKNIIATVDYNNRH